MNNNYHSDFGPCSDACPSCNSDDWKSARMVIMEGTTNMKGTLDGRITNPGKFNGGVKDFLLSDRWFSWDYPIEAEIGLSSSTGLVEEVKRLMVHYSEKVKMPTPLPELTISRAIKEVFTEVRDNKGPIKPEKPSEPKEPVIPTSESMFSMFLGRIIFWTIIIVVLNMIFENDTFLTICILFALFHSTFLSFNTDSLSADYEKKMETWPEDFEQYKRDLEQYKKDIAKYEKDIDVKTKEEVALREKQESEYEAEKNSAIKARELLWEKARVCTRCGIAYLGK